MRVLLMFLLLLASSARAQTFDYPPGFEPPADIWVLPDPPTVPAPAGATLVCPFQNLLAVTAQLSPAHTGQFTRLRDADTVVDVWFYRGDSFSVTLRDAAGHWYAGDGVAPPGVDARSLSARLFDATGLYRGDLRLCADPSPYRYPKAFGDFDRTDAKEVIGSGCSVLSVTYRLDGVTRPPELYMRTLSAPVTPACFR